VRASGRTRCGRRQNSGAVGASVADRVNVAQALRSIWPQGTGCEFWAVSPGSSLSNTNLQGVLRLALLAFIHAMMRSMLGISELQSRKTSGAQAARSLSVPRACPNVGYKTMEIATRNAIKPSLLGLLNERPSVAVMTVSPLCLRRRDRPNGPIRLRAATSGLDSCGLESSGLESWLSAGLCRVFAVFPDICVPLPL
jgi:hypothetical protein